MKFLALEREIPVAAEERFQPLLKDEARQQLASLPLDQAGLIDFGLIPLAPYDGLARLFIDRVNGAQMDE